MALMMLGQGLRGHFEDVRDDAQELYFAMKGEGLCFRLGLFFVHARGFQRGLMGRRIGPSFLAVMGAQVHEVTRRLGLAQDVAALIGAVEIGVREATIGG